MTIRVVPLPVAKTTWKKQPNGTKRSARIWGMRSLIMCRMRLAHRSDPFAYRKVDDLRIWATRVTPMRSPRSTPSAWLISLTTAATALRSALASEGKATARVFRHRCRARSPVALALKGNASSSRFRPLSTSRSRARIPDATLFSPEFVTRSGQCIRFSSIRASAQSPKYSTEFRR
jgi:hypothetical protein